MIKHWAIRRANLVIERSDGAAPEVKLLDHLFALEWTTEHLASVFKTTETLEKSLKIFGASVNAAVRFFFDMAEIKGSHCKFDIDSTDMRVFVEIGRAHV